MFKNSISILFVVLALLAGLLGFALPAMPVFAAPGDIVISYTLPSGTVSAGSSFSIPVNIAVVAGKHFAGGQFNLSYNPAVMTLTSITNGPFFVGNCPAVRLPLILPPSITPPGT